jgi:hypothetical protein
MPLSERSECFGYIEVKKIKVIDVPMDRLSVEFTFCELFVKNSILHESPPDQKAKY